MFNTLTLVGRLTRDAELGAVPGERSVPRVRFTLAVDRVYGVGDETPADFWPCELVGEEGPRLAVFLTRGRLLLVHGSAQIDERRDEGGAYRVLPHVRVRQVRFVDRAATPRAG